MASFGEHPLLPETLEQLLLDELSALGFDLAGVDILVSSNYEAAGEALLSGTGDVAFIPGGTYAVYADGENMDVALTATRGGLTKDSANAKDWNNGVATDSDRTNQVTYYRSIGIVGQTDKGRALAATINGGGDITWADLQDVKIGVQSVTSSAGRVYPSLLFNNLSNTFYRII